MAAEPVIEQRPDSTPLTVNTNRPPLHGLWLTASQIITVCLAALFLVSLIKPEWLPWRGAVVTIQESAAPAAGKTDTSMVAAAKKAMPAVVNIFTTKEMRVQRLPFMDDPLFRRFFGDQFEDEPQQSSSLGSGVIVSEQGYLLTNHHVIEGAEEIEVALADSRRLKAIIVGTDPETDLAVLKVEGKNLPAITFAKSDELQVGERVLAIGNPFGVGQTVTSGIISATGRSHLGINTFENFIQTDAAINPGNSGGALVDSHGNLIGINSAIYSRSGGSMGIGFAIPASLARQVMEQVIQSGSVTRGWVGVEVQDVTAELAESFKLPKAHGALIAGVLRNGPAAKAGVKPGDILVAVNGKEVKDSASMLNLISALEPGKQAKLRILRGETEAELIVTVGKRPKPRREQ
jgi:serine protease DegQ